MVVIENVAVLADEILVFIHLDLRTDVITRVDMDSLCGSEYNDVAYLL